MARPSIDFPAAGGVDFPRLERSLGLGVRTAGRGRYRVSGGADVHWVDLLGAAPPLRLRRPPPGGTASANTFSPRCCARATSAYSARFRSWFASCAGRRDPHFRWHPALSARVSTRVPVPQRCWVTPTCAQGSRTGHAEQRGSRPVQMCLPNGTSTRLISTRYARGSFASSARIVASGVGSAM